MRVITQHRFGGPEVLEIAQRPALAPGSGQVAVTTTAAGVNPVDAVVRSGAFPLLGNPPFVLGWDVAGTVTAVGPDVTGLTVGQRVFGMAAFPAEAGGYAEQVLVQAEQVTPTPNSLDDQHAASLPLVALTAYQALHEVGSNPTAGDRVLIQAAGGGSRSRRHPDRPRPTGAHGRRHPAQPPTQVAFVQYAGESRVMMNRLHRIQAGPAADPGRPPRINPFGGPNTPSGRCKRSADVKGVLNASRRTSSTNPGEREPSPPPAPGPPRLKSESVWWCAQRPSVQLP